MADRYWVGGTGTWDGTSTTNWAASSGGASGASVPTAADNVFFDANSNVGTGTFTVTMATTPRVCNDFTASGLDGTMTLAGSAIGLTVSGSLTFQATNFTRTYTGVTTFNATTTGKTITTNGVAFGQDIVFDGVGGGWTLGSALSVGSNGITLTNGTLSTSASNYAITTGTFGSNNANTRTLTLNGSTLTISSSASAAWNITGTLTLNTGTSTIVFSANALAGGFAGGNRTYYNVSFTGTGTSNSDRYISGTNTFNNLTISTPAAAACNAVTFVNNQTINGTFTASGANGNQRLWLRSGTSTGASFGTSVTLTCAAIAAMSDVDFSDITIAGAAGTLSGTRLGNAGGNSNITFGAGKTVYWNLAAGGNWNANAWATSSGGAVATTNYPLPQDTGIIENTGLNTSATITIPNYINISGVDMSTRTNAMTFATGSTLPYFYGNFSFGSGVTNTGTGTITFTNRSTKTLNSAGISFTPSIVIDAPSGGIQLVTNNMTLSTVTETFTLNQGTLDLNNLTLTAGKFDSSNSNTRTIAFGTGKISCNGTGTVWTTSTGTNLTTTGTQLVEINNNTSSTTSVIAGSVSEANSISYNFISGTYALTFLASTNHCARNIDFTGFAGVWQATSTGRIFGNLKLSTGMTLTASTNAMSFVATSGTKTITTNAKTIDFPITFDGVGGSWQLQDALTMGSTRAMTLTNGTLDLNGNTCTVGSSFATTTGTKNLTFNGGTLVCPAASTTAFSNASSTGFTTTAGTGTGTISMTAATAKTFAGNGSTYNCTLNQGGLGTLTITGANTFSNITNTVQPAQITFPASTTNTFTSFSLSGTAGNLITLRSSSSGTRFTLSDPSGTVSVSYLDIQDSAATGGATWIANDSTNSGNNTGWSFIVPLNGDISATATVVGNGYGLFFINGLINATAAVVGNNYRLFPSDGLINSTATVVGNSIKLLISNGVINSLATVVGKADSLSIINGVITTSATVVGNNYRLFPSNAVIDSAASVSGNGYKLNYLDGIINSAADVSGNNIKLTFANGVIFSNADVIGNAIQQSSINALINSSALVSGNLKKIGEEWITSQPVSTTWFIQ
jgi:hypothetical protein